MSYYVSVTRPTARVPTTTKMSSTAARVPTTTKMPSTAARVPTITKMSSMDLGNVHSPIVGFGNNEALLSPLMSTSLVKYAMDRHPVTQLWTKTLPHGLDCNCHKYIMTDGTIILRDYYGRGVTHLYSTNLHSIRTFNGDFGYLIGTFANDMIVYAKQTSSPPGGEVDIYSAATHQHQLTLTPSQGKTWSGLLSVCRHPATGSMAVVDSDNETLDIYNEHGRSQCSN